MDEKKLGGLVTVALGAAELIEASSKAKAAEEGSAPSMVGNRALLEAAMLAAPVLANSVWGRKARPALDLAITCAAIAIAPKSAVKWLAVAAVGIAAAAELAVVARADDAQPAG